MKLSVWTYEGPPHVGAMRVATAMNGLHYVLHAPQGDTYADLLFTMIERRNHRPPVTYTTFQARDLGSDTAKLFRDACQAAYERFKPQAMIVGASCTAELIQDDPGGLGAALGLPIPVIAMVNGWCMGGGHELALWCDLVIASDNAVLGQTGARVGACPTVGATQYIPRIIGERLAREMIFCARRFTAEEAVEIGLINKCVPQKDLLDETLAWCETIKSHSPQTLRMTKKSLNFESDLLYASWQHGMELLAHVWGSEESLEGMNAFLEGRKPDFNKFRMRNRAEMEDYINGYETNLNEPPSMRPKGKRK